MRKYILTESLKGKAWKTPKEIELEKKLEIAVKALEKYADKKNWEDCQDNYSKNLYKKALFVFCRGHEMAQQALKEIKE